MTTKIQYNGAAPIYETAITGKQQKWFPGQRGDVSDADAALLKASGLGFGDPSGDPPSSRFTDAQCDALESLVSGDWNVQRLLASVRSASAPIDLGAMSSPPTVTTTFDGALTQWLLVDDIVSGAGVWGDLLGGLPYDIGSVSGSIHGWKVYAASYSGGISASAPTLMFCTDAPKVQIRGAAGTWRVRVNGRYTSMTGHATAAGGGEQQLVLDFGSRAHREIVVVGAPNGWISRVMVGALDRVYRARKRSLVRAIFVGDSYTAGTGATYGDSGWASVCAQALGFGDPWLSGLSGTGYYTTGGTSNALGRVTDVTANAPDTVIVALGTNDEGQSIQASVVSLLTQYRAALPGVPIVVLGPWPKNTGPSAAILAIETQVAAAVVSTADQYIAFVPVSSGSSWVTGTGRTGATNGSGNADYYMGGADGSDGPHPTNAGHEYIGRRAATAIANALAAMS